MLWRAYVHRFDLEHTYRFCKPVLNWTTPRARHPEQADRWTWLVLLAYTQLRLARRGPAARDDPLDDPGVDGGGSSGADRSGALRAQRRAGDPAQRVPHAAVGHTGGHPGAGDSQAAPGSYFPSWLEPRRRAEQALV